MNTKEARLQPAPIGRKHATAVLAVGGYVNTGVLIVQGLLLIPLYLHFIGAHLYGLWMASGGILGILGVLNFGISNMLVQRIANAYGRRDLSKAGAYFINGIFVYLVIVFLFMIIGLLLSFFFPTVLRVSAEINTQLRGCFQLAVVAAGAGIINECLRGFAQALLRPVFSMVAMTISRIFGIAVITVLLYKDVGLWAIPMGMLVAEVLMLIAGVFQTVILFRQLHASIVMDGKILKEYFQLGGAVFMAKVGSALSRESDPLIIAFFLRPELTTAYMVTRRAADIVFQMLSIVVGASHSAFSHLVGQGDKVRTAEVATRLLVMVCISGLVGFATYVEMNRSFVTLWVGEAFALEQEVVLTIGLALFANSLRNMVWQILNGLGDYQISSYVIFFDGVAKVLLAAVLLNVIGVLGVPLALFVTSIITMTILFVKLQSQIKLAFRTRDLVYAFAMATILFALGGLYGGNFHPISWTIFMLLSGGVSLGAFAVCALSNRSLFRKLIKAH